MIKTLNSLRFILILMIMISHSSLPISDGVKAYLGECPVAIFFVISGFVLSLSYGERLQSEEVSNKKFFLSRVFKIYPLHLLILILFVLGDWRLGILCPWYQTLAHVLLLQSWVPTHHFIEIPNGPAWFLSDIFFFYIIFKYLYTWIMKRKLLWVLIAVGAYMSAYVLMTFMLKKDYADDFVYFYPPFRLIDFTLGILLYRFCCGQQGKKCIDYVGRYLSSWQTYVADACAISFLIGMCYLSFHVNPNFRCAALYWLPSLLIVFYMVASDDGKGWLSACLHSKALLWLGSISFEMYLLHGLFLWLVPSLFFHLLGDRGVEYVGYQFATVVVLTVVAAWLAKKIIVVPCYVKYKHCMEKK